MHLVFMTTAAGLAAAKAGSPPPEPVLGPDGAPRQNVFMAPTPLFHVTANNCLLHPATLSGSRIVFTYKWDAGRALELIEREGVTNFSGVPTMSRELLMHPDWTKRDTSTLAGMGGGGAPLQPDLVDKIDKSLAGGVPSTGYGLTETHGIVTANAGALYVAKPSSCGRVVPTLDSKLIDELGNEVEEGGVGELCVRGSVVIKGYLNRPEATAESIQDGWFRTGDIARIDEDGFVFIVDRAKDMVLRGGENVYCSEVEAAIYEHPGVAEVAVFGVPDDRLGETRRRGDRARARREPDGGRAPRRALRTTREVQDPRAGVVPQRVAASQRERQVRETGTAREPPRRRRLTRAVPPRHRFGVDDPDRHGRRDACHRRCRRGDDRHPRRAGGRCRRKVGAPDAGRDLRPYGERAGRIRQQRRRRTGGGRLAASPRGAGSSDRGRDVPGGRCRRPIC